MDPISHQGHKVPEPEQDTWIGVAVDPNDHNWNVVFRGSSFALPHEVNSGQLFSALNLNPEGRHANILPAITLLTKLALDNNT
jgi:hypothetical protein